jgi:two-component system, OmpR family, phosphate regulon sensor histidine kinase PhoR
MSKRKRSIPLLVGLASIALVGLIVLQAYLLSIAYNLKEQAFNSSVSIALTDAMLRMQGYETLRQVLRVRDTSLQPGKRMVVTQSFSTDEDTLIVLGRASPRTTRTIQKKLDNNRTLIEYHADSMPVVHVTVNGAQPGDTVATQVAMAREGSTSYQTCADADSARAVFVSTIVDNLREIDRRPIEQRVDSAKLDSILRLSIHQAGIGLEFAWGITKQAKDTVRTDTVAISRPPGYEDELVHSNFGMVYGLSGAPNVRERLAVYFPGRNVYVLSQIWPALGASVLFIVLLTVLFAYTIRTILRQERLAASMVDFVNTMTHEFKTPLSTVTLATEAISRPDVVGRKTKVLQYSRMIADEAARMKLQADRILQLAQLETGELELTRAPLSMHDLIRTTASSFGVQVEARGGMLTTDLRANDDIVYGDTIHLGSVLRSVLDNANKYSPTAPRIHLSTERNERMFVVRIADHGIGIAPEHQDQVFEKFYRVPKGNLHDVKGFGIGLSYVKLITEAHNGTVKLDSTAGIGTTVTLSLPLCSVSVGVQ